MITVRVHLDDCGPDNGPLAVIPGSHRHGFLDDPALRRAIDEGPIAECTVSAGDAVLMRPLLLHGSRKADRPAHRRVAHFEFACDSLPSPLRWCES
jgi:ectoine hydroxylase-related dioxygenase (phytanoyl-CoA dioxygenase family)